VANDNGVAPWMQPGERIMMLSAVIVAKREDPAATALQSQLRKKCRRVVPAGLDADWC